jgi:apolipoprotein N-acyltransferase
VTHVVRGPNWLGAGVSVLPLSAFALGAVSATTFAPLHFFFVGAVAFGGLLFLLDRAPSIVSSFLIGWSYGLGSFLVGLHWITEAFEVDPRFAPLAWPSLLILSAALAIFPALATTLSCFLSGRPRYSVSAVGLAACWSIGEWLRSSVLSGFPWNISGYAWGGSDATLQAASVLGIHGLGLAALLVWMLPAAALRDRLAWPGVVAAVIGIAIWGWGESRLSQAGSNADPSVRIRVVQPNIAQDIKWSVAERDRILAKLLDLSRAESASGSQPTHIVWPESAAPYMLEDRPDILKDIASVAPPGGALILGAVRRTRTMDGQPALLNSVLVLTAQGGVIDVYDKVRLVPFGEYQPIRRIFAELPKLTVGDVDFLPGSGRRELDVPGIARAWPAICYEAAFPDRPTPGQSPSWLLAVTNDAWFGVSWGPYQHLLAARVRAVELGVPLVRSANSGISAVTDAYGRVAETLPLDREGYIDVNMPGQISSPTLYRTFGELPYALVLAGILLGIGFRRRLCHGCRGNARR